MEIKGTPLEPRQRGNPPLRSPFSGFPKGKSVEVEDMMAAIYGRVSSVFLDKHGVLTGRRAFRYDPSVSFA